MTVAEQLKKMRVDWDARARENARHYVATAKSEWGDEEYFASGEETVRRYILTDMENICQGADPKCMKTIEIGCGTGRVTRALAETFGEIHALDISSEMVRRARLDLVGYANARVYRNNGMDLDVLPRGPFDFAFSFLVFQHISSKEVIKSYARSVAGRLRAGALFKYQLQGCNVQSRPEDTWLGAGYCEKEAQDLAAETGFEMRYSQGAGTQEYWLWFFRRVARNSLY